MSRTLTISTIDSNSPARFAVYSGASQVTYSDVLILLQSDEQFRRTLINLLSTFRRPFRFETPPISEATRSRPFEFVLVDAPELESPASSTAFAAQFRKAPPGTLVMHFKNLSGDSTLIVPLPAADNSAYTHLGKFMHSGPIAQKHALWKTVGEVLSDRIGQSPIWLNTAGAAVPWLHVRLDARPKYYQYLPYSVV